jgi:DNA-binding IclR family transcriptional regulator
MKDNVANAPSPDEAGTPTYAAPALDKGLDILELLCSIETPISQKDIALRLGRTVSEIYRMLTSLVARNYVGVYEDTYFITTKMFELSHSNPPTQRLLFEARPVMQALTSSLDQSCHLTVYSAGRQVVIAKVDVSSGMGFSVSVGAELQLLLSASGRVLLAFQDPEIQQLRIAEGLERNPDGEDPQILTVLHHIRQRGFESAPSFQVRGLYAVSFPVLDSQGHAIAALTVPYADRIDQSVRKTIGDVETALGEAAARLSTRAGGASHLKPNGT